MEFDPILPEERISAMTAAGFWGERTIIDFLEEAAMECPDRVAIVGANSMTGRFDAITYRHLKRLTGRMALGLAALGVTQGDVVSFQLPNWWQFSALALACSHIGAVANPMMPIFRHREVSFMLGFAESKVVVVPRDFRGFDYPRMMAEVRADLPSLEHVLVVEGGPEGSFEQALLTPRHEDAPAAAQRLAADRPGANDICELIYTSGTTGQPKGVMHTANTLLGNIHQYVATLGLTGDDIILMASPLAHQTGYLYGMMMPIVMKTKVVLQDVWDAAVAARLIQDEGVTFTMASTPFLADLSGTPAVDEFDTASLRMFLTAGASIPRVLVQRAEERLRIRVISAWGMTENGAATMTRPDDPPDKVIETDGAAIPGMEVRVVTESGALADPGSEGRLQTRGMGNFAGYLKKPEAYDTDSEGWFETGDLARMDAEGYIRISGRSKDILIRGGENVPVAEVESELYKHPAIADVAIVGFPDTRLGERGCAFATLQPGEKLTLEALCVFLDEQKMAKQYFPERLEIVDEMPRTASGKIQKFKLREIAKAFSV